MQEEKMLKKRVSQMTKRDVRQITMPRCTNKWSTPNKGWWHIGKKTMISIIIRRDSSTADSSTTISPRYDLDRLESYSACTVPLHLPLQGMGILLASSNFSIVNENLWHGKNDWVWNRQFLPWISPPSFIPLKFENSTQLWDRIHPLKIWYSVLVDTNNYINLHI